LLGNRLGEEGGSGDATKEFVHYRDSLNSLTRIVDNQDTASLRELYDFVHHSGMADSDPEQQHLKKPQTAPRPRRVSSDKSTDDDHSSRRLSMPVPGFHLPMASSHASLSQSYHSHAVHRSPSINSVMTSTTVGTSMTRRPTIADPTEFQTRRRRAAKLSHFFGVNYRDLFGEVLQSLELGVEEEVSLGSLRPDEVQELLTKLRTLQTRRDEIRG